MPYVPTWKERIEEAKPYVMPAVAGLIVLGVVAWLALHGWRPAGAGGGSTKEIAARLTAAKKISGEVDQLERSYREALEAGSTADAASLLARAIAQQRAVLRLDPGVNPEQTARLAQLESARDALRGQAAAAQSLALERAAASAQQSGRSAGTVEQLRDALRLQREANANAASPDAQDIPREARLAQAIERAASEPLRAALETALTLARSAAAQERWSDALKNFSDARAAQAELNSRFPTAPGADLAALDRIDAEIANLQAAGLAASMAARERDGEAAAAAGRAQEAAAFFAAAAEAQRQLNEKFTRSRFTSATRADELLAKRDTVLSGALLARATALDREITAALARRQSVAAGEKIATALALMEEAAASFPRSRPVDTTLQTKLAYLGARRAELDGLQAEFYARLAPVPGAETFRMLKTEVPQDLFSRVMGSNPSRNAGRTLPVDSVNWLEAQEFCRRASWLLGLRVRLPTEAEFRAAFAGGGEIWSAETSGGHSHEVGATAPSRAGFHDVAGNLSEWLQTGDAATAPVAGGSYLDSTASLGAPVVAQTEKRERARHLGFRVVVEPAAN
jgi:hypothetical protein